MKIGIDIRLIGKKRTGSETVVLNLVKNLAKIDHKNQYRLYTDISDGEKINVIKEKLKLGRDNKNFEIVSVLPTGKAFWTFWSLPREIRKNPVDVLHVEYITPQFFLPKETKIVTTIHDVSFEKHPKLIKFKDLFFLKFLIPLSIKKADRIVAVTNFTKKEIVKYYGTSQKKIEVIHNGGAREVFWQEIPKEKAAKKVENAFGIKTPYIFYVGTLQPRKNIPFLIKGFVKLKKKYQNNPKIRSLQLVIGGGRGAHNYDQKIDKIYNKIKSENSEVANQIKFIGFVEESVIGSIFAAGEALCFTSLYEGFGFMIIEAMASRTPVICSDGHCFPEIAGEAAAIYKEEDLEDFVAKIFTVLDNGEYSQELTEKGINRAKIFSWEKCTKEMLKVYEKVAGNDKFFA